MRAAIGDVRAACDTDEVTGRASARGRAARRSATLGVIVLLSGAALALAQSTVPGAGHGHGGSRPDVFVEVPLDAPTPGVVFPFGGSHHQVPGVVSVNRAPYYCVPHKRAFRERLDFVAHLRTEHGLADDEIAGAVLVQHGQVRYPGDAPR